MRYLILISALVGCGGAAHETPTTKGPGQVMAVPEASSSPTRADVVGAWKTELTDFGAIQIEEDGSFTSHLHDRPFSDGTWTLAGAQLLLSSPAYGETSFTVTRRDGERLLISADGESGTWTRIPSQP